MRVQAAQRSVSDNLPSTAIRTNTDWRQSEKQMIDAFNLSADIAWFLPYRRVMAVEFCFVDDNPPKSLALQAARRIVYVPMI